MNTAKDYVTIHLQLIQIDFSEVIILLMTYLIKLCVPSKTEDLNLSLFNIITGINDSKTLTSHKSCKCKCKFVGRQCNSNQVWNNYECRCECKNEKKFVCGKNTIF